MNDQDAALVMLRYKTRSFTGEEIQRLALRLPGIVCSALDVSKDDPPVSFATLWTTEVQPYDHHSAEFGVVVFAPETPSRREKIADIQRRIASGIREYLTSTTKAFAFVLLCPLSACDPIIKV